MDLQKTPAAPRSLSAAAADHLSDGGFADWARLSLRAGDAVGELSESYARLFDAVTRVREQQAQQFARLLVDWTAADSAADDLVPVEKILELFRRTLAAEAACAGDCHRRNERCRLPRELFTHLARREWIAVVGMVGQQAIGPDWRRFLPSPSTPGRASSAAEGVRAGRSRGRTSRIYPASEHWWRNVADKM